MAGLVLACPGHPRLGRVRRRGCLAIKPAHDGSRDSSGTICPERSSRHPIRRSIISSIITSAPSCDGDKETTMRFAILSAALLASTAAFAQSIPTVDIQGTCKAAAGAMVQLMGGSTAGNDQEICL